MPGAGTDKTKTLDRDAGAGRHPGRAAARREHRRGGARHGEFRPVAAAPGQAARRLAAIRAPSARPPAPTACSTTRELFDTVEAAIADCTFVLATTARAHDQAKPVVGAGRGRRAPGAAGRGRRDRRRAVRARALRARERRGRARRPHRHAFRSTRPSPRSTSRRRSLLVGLRVVQAHVRRRAAVRHAAEVGAGRQASSCWPSSPISSASSSRIEYFRPADKRETMLINLRNIFARMQPTQQDIQTLHGIIMAIAEGRKGPARGGVLDGEEAEVLRTLLAEHGEGAGAGRARAGARAGAAAAAQSDRGRAHAVGRAHQGPPLRRPRLQAADAGRPPHHRLRVVSAAGRDRPRAGERKRGRRRRRARIGAPGWSSAAIA